MPGQEPVQFLDAMARQPLQGVRQPLCGIDALHLARPEEGVQHGGILCRFVRTGEQVVLPSQCQWPDGVLYKVVVQLDPSVGEYVGELGPLVQEIGHGLAHGALWQYLDRFRLDPMLDLQEQGQDLFIAPGPGAFVAGILPFDLFL